MEKPTYLIKKDAFILETLQLIFKTEVLFLSKMKDPILRDNDIENLHIFRVVLRRLRGVMRLFRKYCQKDKYSKSIVLLKELFGKTSELRDYDIFLENISRYKQEFPELGKHLSGMERGIRTRRRSCFKKFSNFLRDGSFENNITQILELFNEDLFRDKKETTSDALIKVMKNTFKKTLNVLENTKWDDTLLHELRIKIKRIRYLFDIFHPLFCKKWYNKYVGCLKNIQDILGKNQDLSFQLNFITNYAAKFPEDFENVKKFIVNQKVENMLEFSSGCEKLKKILSVNRVGRLLQ